MKDDLVITRRVYFSFFLALGATALLFFAGCTPPKAATLTIGISADYPPFTFEEDGEYKGFEVDLIKEIVRKLGYEPDFKDIEFNSLIGATKSRIIDLAIASFSESPERKENVDCSDAYHEMELCILANKPYASIEKLAGKRIGAQMGSTWEAKLLELKAKGLNCELTTLAHVGHLVEQLKMEHLDAVALDLTVGKEFAQRLSTLKLSVLPEHNSSLCIIFPKNSELTPQVNTVLSTMKRSGELEKLKHSWFARYQS